MEDDLEIPAFLRRKPGEKKELPPAESTRTWAPMKPHVVAEPKPKQDLLYSEKPDAPVQVVTTDKVNVKLYDNHEQFKEEHDETLYPLQKMVHAAGITYAVVKASRVTELDEVIRDQPKVYHTVIKQNGIKRPKTDSLCGKAWALYDQTLTTDLTIPVAMEMLKLGGMNPSTVRTQFAHWRTFNGIPK